MAATGLIARPLADESRSRIDYQFIDRGWAPTVEPGLAALFRQKY
jgi:hypothetical protein